MKFTKLLIIALTCATLSFNAQGQNSGPLLWTSYIDTIVNADSGPIGVSFPANATPFADHFQRQWDAATLVS